MPALVAKIRSQKRFSYLHLPGLFSHTSCFSFSLIVCLRKPMHAWINKHFRRIWMGWGGGGRSFLRQEFDINYNQLFKRWKTIKITSSSSRKSSSRRDNCASISASTFFCCSTRSLYLFCVISSVSVSVKIRLEMRNRKNITYPTYIYNT